MRSIAVKKTKAVDPSVIEQAEKVANRFNKVVGSDAMSIRDRTLMVDGPCSLTVMRDGRYSKQAFIGEEELVFIGAYVGKTGKVIMLFSKDGERTSTRFEIFLADCPKYLARFTTFMNHMTEVIDDLNLGEISKEVKERESEAHAKAAATRALENPVFGSW